MKSSLNFLVKHLKTFLEGTPDTRPTQTHLRQNKLIEQVKKAFIEQTAVHVIYGKKSFTGDLIKYDKVRQKIILKNFQQNLSVMIDLDEIDKISSVPNTITHSQKQKF